MAFENLDLILAHRLSFVSISMHMSIEKQTEINRKLTAERLELFAIKFRCRPYKTKFPDNFYYYQGTFAFIERIIKNILGIKLLYSNPKHQSFFFCTQYKNNLLIEETLFDLRRILRYRLPISMSYRLKNALIPKVKEDIIQGIAISSDEIAIGAIQFDHEKAYIIEIV